jgi:four helix bundle protein
MAGKIKSYRELKVWHKSYCLCLDIYEASKSFPKQERFSLTQQLRRSAISIPSNIAEGCGSKTTQQYIHFLYVAYGSLCELETQLLLGRDLNYLAIEDHNKYQRLIAEIGKMLKALIKALKRQK